MSSRFWCRNCDRATRLLADGRACPECHPLAGSDTWRPAPWCGECDKATRHTMTVAGVPARCMRCHPMAHPPQRWPVDLVPGTWTQQLIACEWLCHLSPTLRRLGVEQLREVLRKYFDHRWTPNDVLHALDRQPDGEPHTGVTPVETQRVAGWISRRLRLWEDRDGRPLTPLGDHIAVRREEVIARQIRQREEYAQRAATAVKPADASGAMAARRIAVQAAATARRRAHEAQERELAARRRVFDEQARSRDNALAALDVLIGSAGGGQHRQVGEVGAGLVGVPA